MSNHAFIGNVHFTEQEPQTQYREGQGWREVRTWTGAKQWLGEFVLPDGASDVDVKIGPVTVEIQATYQFLEPTVITWELIGNDHELSIWEHPKIVAILNALPNDDGRVALASKILEAKNQVPPTLPSVLFAGYPNPEWVSELKQFYTKLLLNQDTFYTSQYVLSKTEIGSARNDTTSTSAVFKIDHANVFSIFRYDQLIQEEPSLNLQSIITTQDIWNNLFHDTPIPGPISYVAGVNLVKLSDLGPAGKNLLWQKRTPKVQMLQRGMWQIHQEYWGAENFDKWKYHRMGTPDWVFPPDITP